MAELTMENPLAPSPLAALTKSVADLKECVGKLKEEFEDYRIPLNDDNKELHRFCAKLEFLLQAGMKSKTSLLGGKKDYWNYMAECLSSNKSLNDGIKFVKSISELKTNLGRGRALIRFALVHQRLADTIQQCVINGKLTTDWYHPKAIWLQHKLSSEVIGVLYDLNDLQFDLSPQGYDLDTSWPTFAKKQFGSPAYGNWQPPSRSTSIASLQSIPQLEISASIPPSSPYPTPDHRPLQEQVEAEEAENRTQDDGSDGYLNMDADQLRKRVMELEDENHSIQRKSNEFEVTCEKLKNELALKTEVWTEKEAFYKVKYEDAEKTIAQLQERLAQEPKTAPGGTSEMELKIKLMAAEKRVEALRIELTSVEKELGAKVKVDDAKNALVAMQDKRIAQLKRENDQLMHKLSLEKELAAKEAAIATSGGADVDSQQQIKILVEKLASQESAYAKILSHNSELKSMLNSLEDKCRNIARVAKEKVGMYNGENKKLKEQVAELKACLEQIGGAQAEHKGKESSIQQQITEFRESNAKLGDSVTEVNAIIAAKNAEVERYKARLVELGKALQAAGFHADESTPDDLIDALNESEFLSRQLQSGIESLKEKLGCPPSQSSVVPDASTETKTDATSESETKSQATTVSETKPESTAETETKPKATESNEIKAEATQESETRAEAPAERTVPVVEPAVESETKTKEQALSENQDMIAKMEGIKEQEKILIENLKEQIEEKRESLKELRKMKEESEKAREEKKKQLEEAREELLKKMSAEREKASVLRKDISGIKNSVRQTLDDIGAAVGIDDEVGQDQGQGEGQQDQGQGQPQQGQGQVEGSASAQDSQPQPQGDGQGQGQGQVNTKTDETAASSDAAS